MSDLYRWAKTKIRIILKPNWRVRGELKTNERFRVRIGWFQIENLAFRRATKRWAVKRKGWIRKSYLNGIKVGEKAGRIEWEVSRNPR